MSKIDTGNKTINEYIILGGSGYFGSNFIYWLDWKNIIINIDWNKPQGKWNKSTYKHLQYDLTNDNNINRIYNKICDIERNYFDNKFKEFNWNMNKRILINFAAQSFVDTSISAPEDTLKNNVNIILNMLKLIDKMEENDRHIDDVIHISTDEVHILDKKDIRDVSAYALSKKICEDILLKLSTCSSNKNNGRKMVYKIVRPVNLYGIASRNGADEYGLWQKNKCIITKLMDAVKNRDKTMELYLSNSTRHFINIQRACSIVEKIVNDKIDETRIYLMTYDFHMVIKDLILEFIDKYSLTNISILPDNPRGRFEDDGYGIPQMRQSENFNMGDFWNMIDWMIGDDSE